jgi:diguanylate cyclase (GGDEF)-like protein
MYSSGVKVQAFDQAANRYIIGLYEVLLERLATINALESTAPADASAAAEINKRRKAARRNFEVGLAEVRESDFPNKQALLANLKSALEKADEYRRRADAALPLPRDARDEELRKNFFPVITASVDTALKVWYSALYATTNFDPMLIRLATAKEIGWRMREISGFERANVGSAISAGIPLAPNLLAANAESRSRVDLLWDQLGNLTQDPKTPPAVVEAMAQAREKYFKTYRKLADDMGAAGQAAGKYPTTAQQWTDTTNPLIDALMAVMYAAGAASESYALSLTDHAINDLAVSLGLLVFSLLVMAGVILVVLRQVTRPLTAISKAMEELGKGKFDVVLPGLGRKDEIGRMAQAVEDFKVKAAEKARLEAEELRVREANLQAQNMRFDAAVSNMSQGLVMFDGDARLVICNQRYLRMYSLRSDFVRPGCTLREVIDLRIANDSFSGDPNQYIDNLRAAMEAGTPTSQFVELDDGRTIAVANQPMSGGGWVATHEDITERRQDAAKISHMAMHDALTNLPNRLFFREQIENRLSQIGRDERFAVLCLDLDGFKSVNDTLGHPFGDILLRQVGERLCSCVREGDSVARLGGDEFGLLQASITQPTDTASLMTRIIEVISAPFDLEGHQVVIGISIGVAVAPTDAADPDKLLKNADLALYRAKVDGRGTYRFFEPEMDARMQARRALELDLRRAFTKGEFEVYYQPLVNMKTELVCAFEALIRWNHPERGIIPPLEFIPLAEEIALIVPIGEWVLRQACEEAAKWPSEIRIAVNLSAAQFKTPGLFQTVFNALTHSGLAADRLELEITESVLLFNSKSTLDTLHRLRTLGVRISMDDFGTGYSSLSYLRSFPFTKIKIDRSFVHDLPSNKDSMAIIRAVVGLGNSLGMVTTGEGVETQEELDYLKREGCTEAQGYLFGKARPAKDAATLLAKQAVQIKAVA